MLRFSHTMTRAKLGPSRLTEMIVRKSYLLSYFESHQAATTVKERSTEGFVQFVLPKLTHSLSLIREASLKY